MRSEVMKMVEPKPRLPTREYELKGIDINNIKAALDEMRRDPGSVTMMFKDFHKEYRYSEEEDRRRFDEDIKKGFRECIIFGYKPEQIVECVLENVILAANDAGFEGLLEEIYKDATEKDEILRKNWIRSYIQLLNEIGKDWYREEAVAERIGNFIVDVLGPRVKEIKKKEERAKIPRMTGIHSWSGE